MGRFSCAVFLFAAGCGYVGDPLPPALMIPVAVQDLRGVQRGSKLVLRFSRPQLSTEGIGLASKGELELRIAPPLPPPFDPIAWASAAPSTAFESIEDTDTAVVLQAPVETYAGREIFAAVRVQGPKSRWSNWSNIIALTVLPPLVQPRNVTPVPTGNGVSLSWEPRAERYRIWRQAPNDKAMVELATGDQYPFVDTGTAFDVSYRYQVQNLASMGTSQAESELSAVVTITPEDKFAPASPANLSSIAGVGAVELAWDRNTEADLRGYRVYRTEEGGQMERIGDITETPAYRDSAAASGKKYRYAVTAIDQKGNESARSAETVITAP